MPHSPTLTQNNASLTITHKIWSNNSHLLKLLLGHELTEDRHIIKVNCNFHGHIYIFTKGTGVKLLAIGCASMVSVPTCQTSAKFSFALVNRLINVPTCQRCVNYSIWLANVSKGCYFSNSSAKRRTNFSVIFQKNFSIFEFFNYAQSKFQENLGNSRKPVSRNKEFKFWHLQNFVKEECPKIFDIVFSGACGINRTIIHLL